jgi:hypothetical protein
MARSYSRVSRPHLAAVLWEGRKTANIQPSSGVIGEMPATIPADLIRTWDGRRRLGLLQLATADRGGLNPAGSPLIKPEKLFRRTEPALSDKSKVGILCGIRR